jgi:hypothetical protein
MSTELMFLIQTQAVQAID